MEHKPGFYFYDLYGDLGCIVALIYPDGKLEKIYIGNNDLLNKFTLSNEWYESILSKDTFDKFEYIGL